MPNERFFSACVTFVAVCALLSISSCTIHANEKIAEMVRQGKDPIAAKCAIWGEGNGICQAYIHLNTEGK